jgi:preprotein translocase subunit YajC
MHITKLIVLFCILSVIRGFFYLCHSKQKQKTMITIEQLKELLEREDALRRYL